MVVMGWGRGWAAASDVDAKINLRGGMLHTGKGRHDSDQRQRDNGKTS